MSTNPPTVRTNLPGSFDNSALATPTPTSTPPSESRWGGFTVFSWGRRKTSTDIQQAPAAQRADQKEELGDPVDDMGKKSKATAATQQLQEEIEHLRKALADKENKLLDAQLAVGKRTDALRSDLQDAKERGDNYKSRYLDADARLQEMLGQAKQTELLFTEEHKRLARSLESKDQEVGALSARLRDTEKQSVELKDELARKEADIDELKWRSAQAEERMRLKLEGMTKKHAASEQERESDLLEAEREIMDLKASKDDLTTRMKELEHRVRELSRENEGHRVELAIKPQQQKGAQGKTVRELETDRQTRGAAKRARMDVTPQLTASRGAAGQASVEAGDVTMSVSDEVPGNSSRERELERRLVESNRELEDCRRALEVRNQGLEVAFSKARRVEALERELQVSKSERQALERRIATASASQPRNPPVPPRLKELEATVQEVTRKLEWTSKLLASRTEELSSAQRFITTADRFAISDVSQVIGEINELIFQFSASLPRSMTGAGRSSSASDVQDDQLASLEGAWRAKWGESLFTQIQATFKGGNRRLFRSMVQATLVEWCVEVVCSLAFEGSSGRNAGRHVELMRDGILRAKGVAIAKNWLALAYSQMKTQRGDHASVIPRLRELMYLAGWRPDQKDVEKLVAKLQKKVDEIEDKALTIKMMTMEGILSADVRPFFVEPNRKFNAEQMTGDGESEGKDGDGNEERRVLCTTALGLLRNDEPSHGFEASVSILLKPKVITKLASA